MERTKVREGKGGRREGRGQLDVSQISESPSTEEESKEEGAERGKGRRAYLIVESSRLRCRNRHGGRWKERWGGVREGERESSDSIQKMNSANLSATVSRSGRAR